MELKKNPNVDITKDRTIYRAVGFAFVLAITFLMFSFTFFEKKKVKMKTAIISDDAEQVENTQHEAAPPPPPPPPTLTIVEDVEEETNDFQSTEFEEKQETVETVVTEVKEKEEVIDDEKIYEGELEKRVDFRGGEEALAAFLGENLEYPEGPRSAEITGVIIVTFTVEKNGRISNITTDGKGDKELEAEAKRVISKTSGMWVPGEFKKKPVRAICRIPITFEITDED